MIFRKSLQVSKSCPELNLGSLTSCWQVTSQQAGLWAGGWEGCVVFDTVLCFLFGADVDKALLLQGHKVRAVLSRSRCCAWNRGSSSRPEGTRMRLNSRYIDRLYAFSRVYQDWAPGGYLDHCSSSCPCSVALNLVIQNGLLWLMHFFL